VSVLRSRLARRIRPGLAHTLGATEVYAAAWAAETRRALAAEDEGPLWLALGDSTAQGIGASAFDQGYVGQLRRRLEARDGRPWRVVNPSVSGARVSQLLAEQLPWLDRLARPPDLVTCAIGANDVIRPFGFERVPGRMRELVARLPRGAVLAELPQGLVRSRVTRLNTLIDAEAPRAGLRVAYVYSHTGPPWRGKLAPDEFHPNDNGYADWCAAFVAAIGLDRH
jgi:lysophospholipase L1-like esterase